MKKEESQFIPLRTLNDLVEANEWMFNCQHSGKIDAKSAHAMNTTLKGQRAMLVDLPMQLFKISVQAHIKKVKIDPTVFKQFGVSSPVVANSEE